MSWFRRSAALAFDGCDHLPTTVTPGSVGDRALTAAQVEEEKRCANIADRFEATFGQRPQSVASRGRFLIVCDGLTFWGEER